MLTDAETTRKNALLDIIQNGRLSDKDLEELQELTKKACNHLIFNRLV